MTEVHLAGILPCECELVGDAQLDGFGLVHVE